MVHPLNEAKAKFKKAGGAYVSRDELEEILAPLVEKITRIEGALEIDDLNAFIDELGDAPVSGDPTTEGEMPAAETSLESAEVEKEALSEPDKEAHPAESDPEGHELVAEIHKRKTASRKRKPEGQDPLGLVPDTEED